jgi:putative membrane protein
MIRATRLLATAGLLAGAILALPARPAAGPTATAASSAPASAAAASAPARTPAAPVANAASAQDRQFVQVFGAGGFAAVDAATMAVVRTQDPQLRAYAQQVVHDRTVSNAQLAAIARRAGLPMPGGLDSAQAVQRQRLDASVPGQFELAYVARELTDHQQSLALLQAEMSAGRVAALRSFAASAANLVRQHDAQARVFAAALGVAPAAPAALGYGPATRPVPLPTTAQVQARPPPQPGVGASAQDQRFVQELGANGLAEIDAAQLAAARANDAQVRLYAQQVGADRANLQGQLAAAAQQSGVAMPTAIDGGRLAKRQRLDASAAPQFDLNYLAGEVADQQDAVQLLEGERSLGQAPALRAFAAAALPVVMQHFQHAGTLQVRLSGGLSPGLAAVGADARALKR